MKSSLWVVGIAFALALLCLVAAVASGFGHRLQLWGYIAGFRILTGAVIGAGISIVLALAGAFLAWRNGQPALLYWSLAVVILGLAVALPPLTWLREARQLPYIHDISTDTENPPAFAAILSARAAAPNPAEYGGPQIAKLQKQAYPDIKPLHLRVPPAQAFNAALEAARGLRWKIVERNVDAGRIEASDQTFWYGFIDDVVIRITPLPGNESRVDVRSVSRVGQSDVGTNANRIRKFRQELSERASSPDTR